MNMLIIGHTTGIGPSLQNYFKCEGVDESTGYDITDEIERSATIGYVDQFDTIIINELPNMQQGELLVDLFKIYENDIKHFVVINSCSQDSLNKADGQYGERQMFKSGLDYVCTNLARKRTSCSLTNLRLGLIKDLNKTANNFNSIDPENIGPAIELLFTFPKDMIPTSITLLAEYR
jgi:hypothetical protein